jgi:hypothetical protein
MNESNSLKVTELATHSSSILWRSGDDPLPLPDTPEVWIAVLLAVIVGVVVNVILNCSDESAKKQAGDAEKLGEAILEIEAFENCEDAHDLHQQGGTEDPMNLSQTEFNRHLKPPSRIDFTLVMA